MAHSRDRAARAAGTAALMGALCVLAPHMATAAPAKSAADCRAISDFNLRGQCWDSLDQQNQKDNQAEKKRDFGLGANAPAVAAVKPKKEHVAKVKAPKAPKPENDGVHSLTLTLASVDNSRTGHILLVATDGAIWEQTDGDDVPALPAPGDTVKVSKGMMGGYMCQVTHWQAVRCQRDQ